MKYPNSNLISVVYFDKCGFSAVPYKCVIEQKVAQPGEYTYIASFPLRLSLSIPPRPPLLTQPQATPFLPSFLLLVLAASIGKLGGVGRGSRERGYLLLAELGYTAHG